MHVRDECNTVSNNNNNNNNNNSNNNNNNNINNYSSKKGMLKRIDGTYIRYNHYLPSPKV